MKGSLAAPFLLFAVLNAVSAFYSRERMPESVIPLRNCCPKYVDKVLPKKLVVGYREALNCPLPAIIFVTKKNREVCANPNDTWVQEYIKDPNIPLMPPKNLAQKGQPQILGSPR